MKEFVEKFIKDFRENKIDTLKAKSIFSEVMELLSKGTIRSAEKTNGEWRVNTWVKEAIMIGFKIGELREIENPIQNFFDKDTLTLLRIDLKNRIRLVPGGSAIRNGSYVAEGTVVMPPSYINLGAYVDTGCMIDSHALVGSCAQVGKNVHLSAASQIGGVLEPVGGLPVIIEDDVFIGGNCGIYEGIILKNKAVIGSGVILNASTPVFDNTTGNFIKKESGKPLTIPEYAVIVAGSRPVTKGFGLEKNIHLYCPVLIKYRDDKTDASVALEEFLR